MCIFCQIIAGEIPSYQVYEDERVLAFLDIRPINSGDILVVVKKHAANFEEVAEEDLQAAILAVKKIGRLIKEKLGYAGYNVIENNDPVAGQEVPHLHFHIIPRLAGDGIKFWPSHNYAPGEAEAILLKLKA